MTAKKISKRISGGSVAHDSKISRQVRLCLEEYFEELNGEQPVGVFQMVISEVEKPLLELVLDKVGQNQSRASRILGINRNTLRKKMVDYGLD